MAGALAASILACVPVLYIYNVGGSLLLLGAGGSESMGPEQLSTLMLGLIAGYAMINTIPSILFSAPDDSATFLALPGQKYLALSRGDLPKRCAPVL